MSKLKVTYNNTDITDKMPLANGLRVISTHSLAGEDLQTDETNVNFINDADAVVFVPQAPVDIEYDGNTCGRYYAREQKENGRETKLTAYSGIWLLKMIFQPEKVYLSSESVVDAISGLMGGVPYTIDGDYADETIQGKLNAGTSYDQLFEILLSTGGSCTTESDGTLRIGYPNVETSSVIGSDKIVVGAKIEKQNPLTYLSITAYTFTNSTTYTETVFSTGVAPTGIDTDNAKMITGHYLINNENARSVLSRLWRFYNTAEYLKGTIICDGQRAGDVVCIYRPDTKAMTVATLKKLNYQYGLTEYRADFEALLNYTPETKVFSYTKTALIRGGTGTVSVAQLSAAAGYEVRKIKAVLVGHGGKGENGQSGGVPSVDMIVGGWSVEIANSTVPTKNKYHPASMQSGTVHINSEPGKGGKGGKRGKGGKINVVTIDVVDQTDVYNVEIGDTYTKLAEFSSANGKVYDDGYSIAGYLFGNKGAEDGIDGSDGGAVGQNGQNNDYHGTISNGSAPSDALFELSYYNRRWGGTQGTNIISERCTSSVNLQTTGGGGASVGSPAYKPAEATSYSAWGDDVYLFIGNDYIDDTPYESVILCPPEGSKPMKALSSTLTNYGQGGNGGHGGGGSGAIGTVSWNTSKYGNNIRLTTLSPNNGGEGGDGAPGCILLLF